MKKTIEEGMPPENLTDKAKRKISKYQIVKQTKDGGIKSVDYQVEACAEACKYHGYFTLVSNHEKRSPISGKAGDECQIIQLSLFGSAHQRKQIY